jgi:hypothetical protein
LHVRVCLFDNISASRTIQPLLDHWGLQGRRLSKSDLNLDTIFDSHEDYERSSLHSIDLYEIRHVENAA